MTIEEAIAHAREVAEGCPAEDRQCAYQHDELADWLEELRAYRETGLTPKGIMALAGEVNIWKSDYYDLLKTTQQGISVIYETIRKISGANRQESEG